MRRIVALSIVAIAIAVGSGPVAEAAPPPLAIFPSDTLTVADASQLTGRHVNMPSPNCAVFIPQCDETALVNQLDGFDLDPNVKIGFSGAIDLTKVNGSTVYLERASPPHGCWRCPPGSDDAKAHSGGGHVLNRTPKARSRVRAIQSPAYGRSGSAGHRRLWRHGAPPPGGSGGVIAHPAHEPQPRRRVRPEPSERRGSGRRGPRTARRTTARLRRCRNHGARSGRPRSRRLPDRHRAHTIAPPPSCSNWA